MKKTYSRLLSTSLVLGLVCGFGSTANVFAQDTDLDDPTITEDAGTPEYLSNSSDVTADKTQIEVGENINLTCNRSSHDFLASSHHWYTTNDDNNLEAVVRKLSNSTYTKSLQVMGIKTGTDRIYCTYNVFDRDSSNGVDIEVVANNITYQVNDATAGTVDKSSEVLNSIDENPEGATAVANEGYRFLNWTDEDGNVVSTEETFVPSSRFSATYTATFVKLEEAQLTINYVEGESQEVISTKTYSSEKGMPGENYSFDIELEIPQGYESVTGISSIQQDVEYGKSMIVEVQIQKIEEPENPSDETNDDSKPLTTDKKQDSTSSKGTGTAANMNVIGALGSMSVALAGMIALIEKKKK